MVLTNTAIKNAKKKPKQYRLSDNGNLYLLVRPNGSKLWRLDYSVLGKRKTMALGSYPVTEFARRTLAIDQASEEAIHLGEELFMATQEREVITEKTLKKMQVLNAETKSMQKGKRSLRKSRTSL